MANPLSTRHLTDDMPDLVGDSVKMDIAYEQIPTAKSIGTFYKLVPEEMRELQEAMDEFRESCQTGKPDLERLAHLCKEIYDVTTLAVSFMHILGLDIAAVWKDCVANNLEKLDPDTGKFRKNDYGKILKPEGWQPVDLKPAVVADFQNMFDEYKKFGES